MQPTDPLNFAHFPGFASISLLLSPTSTQCVHVCLCHIYVMLGFVFCWFLSVLECQLGDLGHSANALYLSQISSHNVSMKVFFKTICLLIHYPQRNSYISKSFVLILYKKRDTFLSHNH